MRDPTELDADVVARYSHAVGRPTAVAFGLLDIEGPWFRRERHWGLFHFLLDGHHKTAVAAANNAPTRLLNRLDVAVSLHCGLRSIRRLVLRMLEHDPYDERAHLRLVPTYVSSGRHGDARRYYRHYCSRMDGRGRR